MSLPSPPSQPPNNEPTRRHSRRLTLITRKSNSTFEGSITQMDVFLGSMTAASELFVYSLVEKARQRGAIVAMPSLGNFNPDRLVGSNSPYRSPSRVVVFVVSTHAAGKPSPNIESFLKWLSKVPASLEVGTGEFPIPEVAEINAEPSAPPGDSSPKNTSQSPRKNRVIIGTTSKVDTHPKTLSASLRSSFRFSWRKPFGGSNMPTAAAPKPLHGLQYAVFGVGNSIYRTYNGTAKYIDARLQELGATRACPLGLGDVAKSIDITFAKWETQLLQLIPDQPVNSPRLPSTTARKNRLTSHRVSLPSVITGVGVNSANMLAGQKVTGGPTFVGLGAEKDEPNRQQRRHSTSTMIWASSPGTSKPLLTDK